MSRLNYVSGLLASMLLCFAMQTGAGKLLPHGKGESNYFSSLARLQEAVKPADCLIIGSSMTGRLPDRHQGLAGWANAGIDGGSAMDGLLALNQGLLPTPRVLVIELNSLSVSLTKRHSELLDAMQSPWFDLCSRVPWLSARWRPSSMLYAALLGIQDQSEGAQLPAYSVSARPERLNQEDVTHKISQNATTEELSLVRELRESLLRIKRHGCEVWLVWLPPGRSEARSAAGWTELVAIETQSPWWDLGRAVPADQVFLTDGIHMRADSAWRTMKTIKQVLDSSAQF